MTLIPYVTTSLTLHYLPRAMVSPSPDTIIDAFTITSPSGDRDQAAYRLTPTVYAHLHHACERASSRPISTRPSLEAIQAAIVALMAVYEALISTGVDPSTIPQWSPALPTLPTLPPVSTIGFQSHHGSSTLTTPTPPTPPDATPTPPAHSDVQPTYIKNASKRRSNPPSRTPSPAPSSPLFDS